jgi:hypothetical protein
MANFFSILLVISAVSLMVCASIAVIAPSFGVPVPASPEFPSFATNLDWTVSLTNWSGIGSFFVFVGGLIFYFLNFLAYSVLLVGVVFTLLGVIGPIATGISALIFIAFIGSLLMFLRGSGEGMK